MLRFIVVIFLFGFILVALLGFSVIRSFMSFFFGSPKNKGRQQQQQRSSSSSGQYRQKSQANEQTVIHKKLISEEEGEYVDYEEVKK
ncbi:MAG: DUF4834 family protein [Tannerella sp.]|jgi:hypothetical protein|nr:DUF4834 family protein [Tannerella sp.]